MCWLSNYHPALLSQERLKKREREMLGSIQGKREAGMKNKNKESWMEGRKESRKCQLTVLCPERHQFSSFGISLIFYHPFSTQTFRKLL